MNKKRGLKIVSFLLVLSIFSSYTTVPSKAASGTLTTITSAGQVVSSFNGVDALYRPGGSDGSDSTYGCHAYVIRYYAQIYGKTVYNLFHGCTPQTYGDFFVQVTNPQPGDICAQIKTSTNHWSIVRSVSGSLVTVIDQNNKWVEGKTTYAWKDYTYNCSEVTFYRLASQNGTPAPVAAPAATTAAPQTEAVPANNATVSSVTVMNVNKGKTKKITKKYIPVLESTPSISWQSSNRKVATVSSAGRVKGIKKGSATISGTLQNGQAVSLKVQVKVPATSLKLVSKDVTLPKSSKWKMGATMKPANTTDYLTFKSSNKKVATVSSKGLVKAKKVTGMTTITVTTSSGKKKKCIVRVS